MSHITERHFSQQLQKNLPQSHPFKCPFKDCLEEKTDKHSIMIHYGVDHKVTMDLYLKSLADGSKSNSHVEKPAKKEFKEVDLFKKMSSKKDIKEVDMFKSISCDLCKSKKITFVNQKCLKVHHIQNHFCVDSLSKTPIQCSKCKEKFPIKGDFCRHFIDKHYDKFLKNKEYEKLKKSPKTEKIPKKQAEPVSLNKSLSEELPKTEAPLPKSREMKTVHGSGPREMKTIHRPKELQTHHDNKSPSAGTYRVTHGRSDL